jgi:starch-binding outer membrane protein, SusD/RagB family
MKNNKIYSVLIGLVLLCGSCGEDFLNKTDPTVLVAESFYETETQLIQAVNGVYGQLQPVIRDQWQFTEFITDNTTLHFNPGNRGQGPALEALEFWQYNAATPNITSLYNNTYGTLVNVNTTLTRLSDANASDEIKLRSEGELKFIRAYLYFLLVQYFGDVILITEPVSAPSEAFTYEREPIETVYQQIISDLEDAIAGLPASYPASEVGRVTKGAALTLLGKVRLTRHEYPQAIETLNQVLSLGYAILGNYADVFSPGN